jgi:indole-3-glycerol phosphate synthase
VDTILHKITRIRGTRLAEEMSRTSLETLQEAAMQRSPARDFAGAFVGPGMHIIAEVKKASPSRGVIKEDLDAKVLASAYQLGGATAVSVLTEQDHFQGNIQVLTDVRATVSLPILRKDFITDPYQIVEARAAGADSFLLIAALLDQESMRSLIQCGRDWQMEALVEVHDLSELRSALEVEARLIGINNRDLKTFQVDLNTTLNLIEHVPADRIIVSESGIQSREEMLRLADAGVRGFLIGETLVRAEDPAGKIKELLNGAR